MKRYQKFILILCVFGITTIMHNQIPIVQGQAEQEASAAIQEADEKLTYVLELLEEISIYDEDIRNLILQTDDARQLIKEAKDNYASSNFTISYQKATGAILQLDSIIGEIDSIIQSKTQNKIIIFSLVGVLAGLGAIMFSFLFISKIYPWYEKKKIEEYSKLEINYNNSKGEMK